MDEKFEGKLICFFKNNKNMVNFYPRTQKSQKFAFLQIWSFPVMFDLKKYRGVIFYDTRE